MPIEIQQALIGLGGSIIGALIGSGIIGYLLNIKKEKSDADKRTYFFIKSLVSNNHMTFLKDANFYNGVLKEIVDNIYEIDYWAQKPGSFNFHNKKIQASMNKLLHASHDFARQVPNKTLPSGTEAYRMITTMTDAARSNEEARRRNQEESDELIDVARSVYDAVNELDTVALKELRLSPADMQQPRTS